MTNKPKRAPAPHPGATCHLCGSNMNPVKCRNRYCSDNLRTTAATGDEPVKRPGRVVAVADGRD